MFGFLLIGVGIVLLIVYFSQNKKDTSKKTDNNVNKTVKVNLNDLKGNLNKKSSQGKNEGATSAYVKNTKNDIPKKDLFDFMEFEKIQDDMIIQDKGSKFTMVLQCKGINYDLMSEVEQLAVEEGFITFLNTLTTPIQLYVQARAIDLKTSLNMYKDRVAEFNKEYEETAEKYNKLANSMNTSENELAAVQIEKEKMFNISEYAHDITRYVEKLSLNKHMLQRKFYVILSYYKSEINSTTKFSDEELFDICYRELYTRAQGVVSALQTCSVSARVMDSNELAELIYITYNRDDQKLLDIRTALESGFYRMYSTTKDIHEKKNELLKKQIQEEAMNRLETAIKVAIQEGRIVDPEQQREDFEEDVDKTAILMAEELDMPEELKENVQSIIYQGHKKAAQERKNSKNIKRIINETLNADNEESNKIIEENNDQVTEEINDEMLNEETNSEKAQKDEIVEITEEISEEKNETTSSDENDSIV